MRSLLRFVNRYLSPAVLYGVFLADRLAGRLRAPGGPGPAAKAPERILVVKLVGLGDTVLMLPAIKRLREAFPAARLDALTSPLCDGVLRLAPWLDGIVVYDVLGSDRGLGGFLRVVRRLRQSRYDLVVDFEQHLRLVALLDYLTGAPRRIGFDNEALGRGRLLTDRVRLDGTKHMVESFDDLLRPIGISRPPAALEPIPCSERARRDADRWLADQGVREGDAVVGMHAGSGGSALSRRWPLPCFAQVANRLTAGHGVKILLTGGAAEAGLIRELAGMLLEKPLSAAGNMDLETLAALLSRCRLFISNDTGPMHMSAAMGTPTLGLFGPQTPVRYAPFGAGHTAFYKGLPCSPCINVPLGLVSECANPDFMACMKAISPDEVYEAARAALARPPRDYRRK